MSPKIMLIDVQSLTGPLPDERELKATAAAAGLGALVLPSLVCFAVLAAGAGLPSAEALALWIGAYLWAAGGRARQQIRRLDAWRRLRRVALSPRADSPDLRARLQLANRVLAVTHAVERITTPTGAVLAGVHSMGHGIPGWPCIGGWDIVLLAVVIVGGPALAMGTERLLRTLDDRRRFYA